ncbi:protein zwilch homolog [Panulirus ornatus]|uniref:protein zwilch homolog n=1 Tax=Panulirus ornatus TaxID=150431 RepID=UPI003A8C4437
MKDLSDQKPSDIRVAVERLLSRKSEVGEYVVVDEVPLIVTRETCPKVLLSSNKQIPEIILIQKYTQNSKKILSCSSIEVSPQESKKISDIISQTPSNIKYCSDDLDVTGSPLKCPFMQKTYETELSPFMVTLPLSKKKNEHFLSYTPVHSTKAGLIASKFNLVLSKMSCDTQEYIPLWVVCDGKDAQGTLFIGLRREEDRMSRTVVTSSGPYYGFENLPTLDHLKMHHTAIGPTKLVESAVEATYEVLQSEENNRGSSLKLICNWKKPLTILTPPAPNAITTANVTIVCSDPRSAAYQMYQELCVLRGFMSGLQSGEVSWFVREGTNTVAQDIEEIVFSTKERGHRQKKEEDGGSDFDMMIEGKFFNRRQNMDFTDLLWTVLIRCESFQELRESLGLVFEAVSSGEVRPQIHVRNVTQVGRLSRNLMRGQGGFPELSGLTPLHMLIEMGCEKIKRDYINIFQAGELATGEQLSWFVSYDKESPEVVVSQLERLHIALQVVVALRTYLSLSSASLTQCTTQVLKQLKGEEFSSSYTFSFKLETLSIHQLLNSLKSHIWEVSLCSSQGSFMKTLVCQISHTPLIQISSADGELDMLEDTDKDIDEKSEDCYFCSFITTVTDKIFPY